MWCLSAGKEEKMSGGMNSIEAVKKKIKVLQDQAEEAEERAERLQKEVEKEKRVREEVCTPHPHSCADQRGGSVASGLRSCQVLSGCGRCHKYLKKVCNTLQCRDVSAEVSGCASVCVYINITQQHNIDMNNIHVGHHTNSIQFFKKYNFIIH